METLQDKILGCWFGMAVGDAMGMAVKGLKPDTVKQCFGSMNDYKDVRKFIGKGVKQYRMQGLYGVQTQSALVVCDSVLAKKKLDVSGISTSFLQLAANGPENYFGVFRHAEGSFRLAVQSLAGRDPLLPAENIHATGRTLLFTVPVALFHQKESPELIRQCMDIGLLMSRHPMEVIGSVLTGRLVTHFLSLNIKEESEGLTEKESQQVLKLGVEVCDQAELILKERYPEIFEEFDKEVSQSLRKTLEGMLKRFSQEEGPFFDWICENASGYVKTKITHPAQSHVLTLLPLTLWRVLRGGGDFASILTKSLNMGKEATLLGTLVGAFSGALFGFENIPAPWRSGLVNSKEIKARGEALFHRRAPKGLKEILEMESSLTEKENEERKKYLPKSTQKLPRKASPVVDFWDEEDEEPAIPRKEDAAKWRKFQKDKTRMKRDRRRGPKPDFDMD